MRHTILEREQSSDGVRLAPLLLRQQFRLKERDFLLAMAALAPLSDASIRGAPDPDQGVFPHLEWLCRKYGIPLAALVEEYWELKSTKEVVRLPRRLSAEQQQAAWGLPRQREGVTAVFHGPSSTGKTMAASAIAHRLGMPLLRADLSQMMDWYVGETEQHLGRLFRSARENHCVLLFDEADSLFGKRAQVSSGHDKYANLSTSYLLQEIERYDGIAVLSTNLLSNFDEAFLRRLQYIVRFGLPDAALRETLWRPTLPRERCAEELPYVQLAQAELSLARILAAIRGAVVQTLGNQREKVDLVGIITALKLEKGTKSLPKLLAELCQTGKGGTGYGSETAAAGAAEGSGKQALPSPKNQ